MADNILKARVRHAYKTDAEWANANPILLKGEIAYSSDIRQTKTGDGTAHWADLEYDVAKPAWHEHDLSEMINKLNANGSIPKDNDYYISQYVGGGTTTTTYQRRPMSALWEYIKSKANSVYTSTTSSASPLRNRSVVFCAYYGCTRRGGGLRAKASLDGAAPKPLSAGHLSAGAAVSAPQCGDAGSGSGVLPAVHDLSPADLCQLPAGPAAAGRGCHSGRGAGVPAPGDRVLHRGVPHLCGPEPQCEAAAVRPVLLPVLPHAGHQHADALRADRLSPGPAPGRAAPAGENAAVHGGADRHHRPDPDADVRGRPAAALRRGQLRPAPVLGGAVGEAAVPGGGGGRVFRPVLPVRTVSGRPPALAEHLARHYGGPGGLAGAELAVLHIRGELCRLLPAVRLHRHGHRPFDLAVYDRRDPYHGGGAERHADLPAKGPGGGIVNDF